MDLTPYLRWEVVPLLVQGLVYVGLGAWIALLARRTLWMWAFAVYLIVDGLTMPGLVLLDLGPDVATQNMGQLIQVIGLTFLILPLTAFALSYPAPRGSTALRRTLLAVAASAVGFHYLLLTLGLPYTQVVDLTGAVRVAPNEAFLHIPLVLPGIVAFLLAHDIGRAPDPYARRSIWLATLGFALYPLYRGIRAAYALLDGSVQAVEGGVWSDLAEAFSLAVVPLVLVAFFRLARTATTPGGRWGVLLTAVAAVAFGLLTAMSLLPRAVTVGAITLVLPLVVSYAILRLRMGGLDVKVRWTLSKSAVAGIVIALFFVGSQLIQTMAGDQFGPLGGGILAGLALFAINPIQRAADRIATAAIPTVAGSPAMAAPTSSSGDEETYRHALRKFLADGAMSRDEERHLARLTTSLGIDAARAFDLREQTEKELAGKQRAKPPKKTR